MVALMQQFDLQEAFRRNIKARRIFLGMTQAELAEKIGTKQSYVAQVESGDRSPRLDTVQRFLDALHMRPNQLFADFSEKTETVP